ncbi:DUF6612 family protein [Alkalicoccobacillus gibsonii]|uniref:DUF6612 family protein n=1 Tax=Alkalicoccobacillus gibsonii TaxID=79881 RepID=UPI00193118D8|nr:DUF6612 family protein [Alkalicoccobacillus gibsonii]MBM0066117.1 hypothetical protein [Alkalicoccobacillus gibsonii]
MKKIKWLVTGLACTVALVACGSNDATTEENDDANSETEVAASDEGTQEDATEETEEENSTEDAKSILEQSINVMNDVESFSMDFTMDQDIEMEGEEPLKTSTNLKMDAIQKPLSFYQVVQTPDPMTGEVLDMEQYFVDGEIYTYEPTQDMWIKMSGDLIGMNDIEDLEMSPDEQLETLLNFADDITVEEDGDRYALTINGSGNDLKDLAQELANAETDATMQAETDQLFEGMNISKLDYVLYINKETYYQEEMKMNLDMEMDSEGDSIKISQVSNGIFDKFNEIDEITVPSEALDNAVEMTEEDLGSMGGEWESTEEESDNE